MTLVDTQTGEVVDAGQAPVAMAVVETIVKLDELGPGPTPRRERIDINHVNALVESGGPWPPITLCRADWGRRLRVLDGNHRVAAAERLGLTEIPARIVDLDVKSIEAYAVAAEANSAHGLPYTLTERRAAAKTLIENTDWSDNWVAHISGLSDKTIAGMRPQLGRAGSESPNVRGRQGLDGKTYPGSQREIGERRETAAKEITANPAASDRQVGKSSGLSPRTVANVRKRTDAGQDPAPESLRNAAAPKDPEPEPEWPKLQAVPDAEPEPDEPKGVTAGEVLGGTVPADWLRHPAANRTNATREFMRFMNRWGRVSKFQEERQRFVAQCPPDAVDEVILNAEWMARQWTQFAGDLKHRPTLGGAV